MQKIWQFLRRLFRSAKKYVQQYVTPAVTIAENIKMVIDSPVADLLTAIIPGTLDDMLKDQARKYLPVVVINLGIAKDCISDNPEQVMQCAIAALSKLPNDGRNSAIRSIAQLLVTYLADGKLSAREIVHLTEETYQQLFKKA